MKKSICMTAMVVIMAGTAYARPSVGLGLKMSRHMVSWEVSGDGYKDYLCEYYWGISCDAVVNFSKFIALRLETIELKKFDNRQGFGDGGYSYSIFSDLDADIIFILPLRSRIAPLVYAGMNLEKFENKPMDDPRGFATPAEWRIGCGALYRLREKSRVQFELQIYDQRRTKAESYCDLPGCFSYEGMETIGLNRANLGFYYEF